MNEVNDYVNILEEYLKYYTKASIRNPRLDPNIKEAPGYDKKYGTVHIAETIHNDDFKIRTINFTDSAGESFSFIIGPALMLSSSRYSKYREELIDTWNIKGVIFLEQGIISESLSPSGIIIVDKNYKPQKVWFSSASTITEIFGLIFEEKSEHHKIYYSDAINSSNLSPEYYNLEKFSVKGMGNNSVSTKELEELADIIPSGVITSRNLKKSGIACIRAHNLVNGSIQKPNEFIDISTAKENPKGILQEGDILLTGVCGQRKIAQVKSENLPAFASGGLIIIRPHGVSGRYLYRYLTSQTGKKAFDDQLKYIEFGCILKRISLRDLKHIQVPIYDEQTMRQIENIESVQPQDLLEVLKRLLDLSKCEKNCEQHVLDELQKIGWKKESFCLEQDIKISENESYRADIIYNLDDGRLVVFETKISIDAISPEWINRIQLLLSNKENLFFILTNGYYYEVHKSGISSSLKMCHAPSIDDLLQWEKKAK